MNDLIEPDIFNPLFSDRPIRSVLAGILNSFLLIFAIINIVKLKITFIVILVAVTGCLNFFVLTEPIQGLIFRRSISAITVAGNLCLCFVGIAAFFMDKTWSGTYGGPYLVLTAILGIWSSILYCKTTSTEKITFIPYKIIFLGMASAVGYDIICSVASLVLGFSYERASAGSLLIYAATGYATKERGLWFSFLAGAVVGLIDSTIGWGISWLIGPGRIPMGSSPFPVWFITAAGVVVIAAVCAFLGCLIGNAARSKKWLRFSLGSLVLSGSIICCATYIEIVYPTPLMQASHNGDINRAITAINTGTNMNAKNFLKQTALMIAVSDDKTEVAKLLIDKGAGIDDKDIFGNTALADATLMGKTEIAIKLIDKGANLDGILRHAVLEDNPDIVRELVKKGADLTQKDRLGKTPLRLAEMMGRKEIATILRQASENGQ